MPPQHVIRKAVCAVVSESPVEAELVRSLLARDFKEILTPDLGAADLALVARENIAVVVLAFPRVTDAEAFHQRYAVRRAATSGLAPQMVLLCSRDEVTEAYELCRKLAISDYVMFWPVTHDPKRLAMAVHRACDAYERGETAAPDLVPPTDKTGMITGLFRGKAAPRGPEVLVVDDDAFQQQVVATILESAGYHALGVMNARSALDLLKVASPALILLDVDMPEINGIELLRRIKADARTARTPVIMLTGMREKSVVLNACQEGAADFIVKPFQRDTLIGKIGRILAA
jgi:CheY-like chemotaxis protein